MPRSQSQQGGLPAKAVARVHTMDSWGYIYVSSVKDRGTYICLDGREVRGSVNVPAKAVARVHTID